MDKYIVIRDVTPQECDWLDKTVAKGTVVLSVGDPWGCCGQGGIMVEYEGSDCPSELPEDALRSVRLADTEVDTFLN